VGFDKGGRSVVSLLYKGQESYQCQLQRGRDRCECN
jgi:hypothetical protein